MIWHGKKNPRVGRNCGGARDQPSRRVEAVPANVGVEGRDLQGLAIRPSLDNTREVAGVSEGIVSKASEYAGHMKAAECAKPEEWSEKCSTLNVHVGVSGDGGMYIQSGAGGYTMKPAQALALAAYIQRVWGE